MRLTSYKETGPAAPIGILNSNTADGMRNTHKSTGEFADKSGSLPPENTRANPADRVKRFRQGISWRGEDDKLERGIFTSEMFKKSASLFIHCVLSAVYGETVTMEYKNVNSLINIKKSSGREHFLNEMIKALYGDGINDAPGMTMNRDEIIYIRHGQDQKLIGLLSPAGPVLAVENELSFLNLPIDKTDGLGTIIEALNDQDKQILKIWFEENKKIVADCRLYREIESKLQDVKVDLAIKDKLICKELKPGIPNFPILKDYTAEMLLDSITLTPVSGENAQFGYDGDDMPALRKEINGLFYVFIPPLTRNAVEWLGQKKEFKEFVVKSIDIDIKETFIGDKKVDSVTICCVIAVGTLKINIRKKYESGKVRYIKKFPSLSLYGPAPKFGWIARRDITPKPELEKGNQDNVANNTEVPLNALNDISFFTSSSGRTDFENIENDYSIYCGEIPEWLGIDCNGNFLGALPLRAVSETRLQDWKNPPAFIHSELPGNKKMIVAVDIGSSRSVVLFREDGASEDKDEYTLIEKGQILGIHLTSPLDINDNRETEFEHLFFQPEEQNEKVSGKTPVGVLPTTRFDKNNRKDLLLYRSGKLILLYAESISKTSGKEIISDIKSRVEERENEMGLLIQGILMVIVDRSLHLKCSNIEIRLAYLTEQYNKMESIWNQAIYNIERKMPPELRGKIKFDLWLPESLAIANRISKTKGFYPGSGAALVDIGDLSTDIALFRNEKTENSSVELRTNFSVRFAGNKILLQPIWEYLHFSKNTNTGDLFRTVNKNDKNVKNVLDTLKGELDTQRETNNINLNEKVRNNLLCLIGSLEKGQVPQELQNLFDIGYLTEVIILKRIIKKWPDQPGAFNIHLFGGGSSHFREKKDDFNWDKVLGRFCETHDESKNGNMLARGLLDEEQNIIENASREEKRKAKDYEKTIKKQVSIDIPSPKELENGYKQFLEDAKSVKPWYFMDSGNKINFDWVFNFRDGKPIDSGLWKKNYVLAEQFARDGKIPKDDNNFYKDIFETLFAYKMAYSSVLAFYKGERENNA